MSILIRLIINSCFIFLFSAAIATGDVAIGETIDKDPFCFDKCVDKKIAYPYSFDKVWNASLDYLKKLDNAMKGKVVKSNIFTDRESGFMFLTYITEGHRPSRALWLLGPTGALMRGMSSMEDIFTSEKMILTDEPISLFDSCGKYLGKSFIAHNLLLRDIDKQRTELTYNIRIFHHYNCPDKIGTPRLFFQDSTVNVEEIHSLLLKKN